jgi:Holliday junction resolvasome RuvABC endonuclease subunit
MIILGLDVSSSSTGWSVIEANENTVLLKEYGLIRGDSSMNSTQRLYFQGNELKKIIEKIKPDEIGIEETVLVRGPKIMRTLSRFSGVAIFQSYSYQKKDLHFFEPSQWKKYLGIGGGAKKVIVQLEICEKFNKISQKQLEQYREKIENIQNEIEQCKLDLKKQGLNRKEINKKTKIIEKQYDHISTDIFSDCGINADIADSIGISLAVIYEKK